MVSETILVALVSGGLGLSGSIIVALFSIRRARLEQESEDKRLYAEFVLQRKIEALQGVYEEMEACYSEIRKSNKSLRYHEEVSVAVSNFQSAVSQNYIWMDSNQREVLQDVVDQVQLVEHGLEDAYPRRQDQGWTKPYQAQLENEELKVELEKLDELVEEARRQLRLELEQPIQELNLENSGETPI